MLLRDTHAESSTDTSFCEPLESRLFLAAVGPTQVRGDFTGDGRVDIVTTQGGLKLRVGTAKGFKAGVPIDGVGFARGASVAAGDFNKDGSLDLAVFGGNSAPGTLKRPNGRHLTNGGLFELLNNGNGTFQSAVQINSVTSAQVPGGRVVTGDFNLDGNTDIVVTNGVSSTTPTPVNGGGTSSTGGGFAGTTGTTTGATGALGTSAFGGSAAGTGLATGTSDLLGGMSNGGAFAGPVGATTSFGSVPGAVSTVPGQPGVGPPPTPSVIVVIDGNGNGTFQTARRVR